MTTLLNEAPISQGAIELLNQGTFGKLHLWEFIQKAIIDLKFTEPSDIQKEAIPIIMAGTDIIAQAPTGSGKTAAFAIPILQKLDLDQENRTIQALVLCPTRELTMQVHKEFEKFAKYQENISIVSIYGGQHIDKQLSALNRNPQIIVATPGRLMDHIARGSIELHNLKMVVLDEADEMLDMGFREDINTILEKTPAERQTVLFSATMAKDIIALTKKFQKYPTIIDVRNNLQNAPNIEQFYFEVVEKDKLELITRLLDLHSVKLALIFCNTRSNVNNLVENLKARGYFTDALHGDMNQAQREKVMSGFRKGSVRILIATDVAGRGIDVKNIEAVFNYDLPRDDEDYIHRIGRTARAGTSGVAFTFVSKRQIAALTRIERANGIQIHKKECPTVEQLDLNRFDSYCNEIEKALETEDLTKYVEIVESMVSETTSAVDIAAALFRLATKKEHRKINTTTIFEEEIVEANENNKRQRKNPKGRSFRSSTNEQKPFKKFDKSVKNSKFKSKNRREFQIK